MVFEQRHLRIGPVTLRLDCHLPAPDCAQLAEVLDPFTVPETCQEIVLEIDATRPRLLHPEMRETPLVQDARLVWPALELTKRDTGWVGVSIATADPVLLAVRSVVASGLLDRGGLMLHASSVSSGGVGHLFLGTSGAGKTTIACESDVEGVFSDEISILAPDGAGDWLVWPSPFWGAPPQRRAVFPAPVRAAWILQPGEETRVGPMSAGEAAMQLYLRAFEIQALEQDPQRALEVISQIIAAIPVRTLSWKRGDSLRSILEAASENPEQ